MLPRRRMASSHVIYTSGLFVLTAAFALIAIVILVLRFSERTEVLKVAVGPADGDDAKLIAAIGRHLERDRARTRFVIIPANDPAESAKALESGHADLAVIRSDVAVPPNGATIIILHNDAVTLATPPASKTTKVTDLRTKQVGVFPPTAENAALLDAILGEYDIAPETVQHVMLREDDLSTAAAQKRVDAILAVGPFRSPYVEHAALAFATRDRAPTVIPIDGAEGMAARNPFVGLHDCVDDRNQRPELRPLRFLGSRT
jgi:TRAP-type uncharacterized transport system substrate-binding protein